VKSKLLPHALAPLDYHMFGPLTTTACVDEDLQVKIKGKDMVNAWLLSQLKAFLVHGIRRLVKCYT